MSIRKLLLLATTALIVGAGCEIMPNKSGLVPAQEEEELGPFGLPIGEPINVISATRGDGVSFDNFQVTFNNAEGTDITITTPEGETINFTEADLEWAGWDPNLGIEVARLTSSRGDRLDVTLGTVFVQLQEDAEDAEYEEREIDGETVEVCVKRCEGDIVEVPVSALARLDETDTRAGFETYGVVGGETDVANLPRNQEDQEGAEYELDQEGIPVLDDDGNMICVAGTGCAGELAEGTAYYYGDFVASVSRRGENVSDTVTGSAEVEIDFAGNSVDIWLDGSYNADDVDDRDDAVTSVSSTDASAITSVTDNTTQVVGSTTTTTTPVVGSTTAPITGVVQFVQSNTIPVVGSTNTTTDTVVDSVTDNPATVVGSTTTGSTTVVSNVNEVEDTVLGIGTGVVAFPINEQTTSVVNSVTDNTTTVVGSTSTTTVDVVDSVTDNMVNVVNSVIAPQIGVVASVTDNPVNVVDSVTDNPATVVGSTSTTAGQFLTSVSTTTEGDNSDSYGVSLYGSGSSKDLLIGFNGSVKYEGLLDGTVDVPSDNAGPGTSTVGVAGTFGGAVYGPGAAAASDPANFSDVVNGTATAGVFQADSGQVIGEADDGSPMLTPVDDVHGVDITGGYIAPID